MISLIGKWGRRGRPPKAAYHNNNDPKPPVVTQRSYLNIPEEVDRRFYSIEITCRECGKIRWVKPQDRHQVSLCKPCTRHFRLQRRRERAAIRALEKKVEAAEGSLTDWGPEDA